MNRIIVTFYLLILTSANPAEALAAQIDSDSARQFAEFETGGQVSGHITIRDLDSAAAAEPAIAVLGQHKSTKNAEKLKHDELLKRTQKRIAERERRLKGRKKVIVAKRPAKKTRYAALKHKPTI